MEDTEITEIWKSYDSIIKESKVLNLQSWVLNLRCFEQLQTQKVKSKLKSLIIPKIIGIVLGIGWILFLGFLFYYTLSQIFMAVSLGMILLFSIAAVLIYIRDVFIIAHINYSENILQTQKKIASLQSSIINSVRVLWLQLPFYTTCYITNKLAATGGISFWIFQTPVTLLSGWLAVFLFKNISLENIGTKRVRGFLRGYGLSRISTALDFIKEIDAFKKDLV